MRRKKTYLILTISLLGIGIFTIAYPHLMISSGDLLKGHQALTEDCLSCHTFFEGTPAEKCISCHSVDKIGLFTSQGAEIKNGSKERVAFHQNLIEQKCSVCHTDHLGIQPKGSINTFSHELLDFSIQKSCTGCHRNPENSLHQKLSRNCDICHDTGKWTPTLFKHELLEPFVMKDCISCHPKLTDSLHQQMPENCDKCHSQTKWVPATFDHGKYFRFDRDHPNDCKTCHVKNDYRQYTCYECHEHRISKIKKEHFEEGIYEYEKCVECHRSGDEDEAKRRWRKIRDKSYQKGSRQPTKVPLNRMRYQNHDDDDDDDD